MSFEERETMKKGKQKLQEEFNFSNEKDFLSHLKAGNVPLAKRWLQYIIENKEEFPEFFITDRWLADRKFELFDSEI